MTLPVLSQPLFEIRKVAVIGTGVAGRSFALACAAAGFHVVLEDVMPANLRRAEADFAEMDLRDSAGRMELASTVEDVVRMRISPWISSPTSLSRSWKSSA